MSQKKYFILVLCVFAGLVATVYYVHQTPQQILEGQVSACNDLAAEIGGQRQELRKLEESGANWEDKEVQELVRSMSDNEKKLSLLALKMDLRMEEQYLTDVVAARIVKLHRKLRAEREETIQETLDKNDRALTESEIFVVQLTAMRIGLDSLVIVNDEIHAELEKRRKKMTARFLEEQESQNQIQQQKDLKEIMEFDPSLDTEI